MTLHDVLLDYQFARLRLRMLSTVDVQLADEVRRMASEFYKIRRELGLSQAWDPHGPLQQAVDKLDPIQARFNLIRLEKGML